MATVQIASDDQKPKRGRPRGGKADIAEKRRQQLRLAQRAYRDRKENTINELQKRVEDLTGQIEQINQSFIDFSDLLLESNVLAEHPSLISSLGCLTRKCISLAQNMYDGEGDAPINYSKSLESPSANILQRGVDSDETPTRDMTASDLHDYTKYSSPTSSKWLKPSTSSSPQGLHQDNPSAISEAPLATIEVSPPSVGLQPPLFVPYSPPVEAGRVDFIKTLVQRCCRGAYSLLVNPEVNIPKTRNAIISSLYYVASVGEENDIALRANVLAKLREQLTREPMENSEASARAWDIAFGSVSGTEWLDANQVLKLLVAKGIQARGNDLFIPIQHAGIGVAPESAFLFDMATFIKAISVRAICMCPGPAFRRRDMENVLDFLVAHYGTINRQHL
ncbi:hypothetical protein N7470_005192 [Penicillium chermesinum]|nr:hypothetical protein N7470_005192 [Penicillium chermesinum]